MKTTVEISDALLAQARALAAREGTTLRDLVERGLRAVLAETPAKPYALKDCSFDGGGLRPEAQGRSFAELLDWSYGGKRGGSDAPGGVNE